METVEASGPHETIAGERDMDSGHDVVGREG